MNTLLFVLNMVGTIAFAVSGGLTAIANELDLLGVIILGTVTAVGGGIMRDLIIGVIPPTAFVDSRYTVVAVVISVIVFAVVYFHIKSNSIIDGVFRRINFAADTVGLAIFSVVGVQTAFEHGIGDNWFLCVFLGALTGVGGGVLRDVLANDKPYIFSKHIYACASLIGALLCTVMWERMGEQKAMLAGAFAVIVIRCLAAHFKWNLPKIRRGDAPAV